jgi:hypothetical protein
VPIALVPLRYFRPVILKRRLGVLVLALIPIGCSGANRTGDPGGRLVAELRSAAAAAIPPGADTSAVLAGEPRRDSCDGRPETRGWDPATVSFRFATALSPSDLAAHVDATLMSLGWRRTTSESTPGGAYFRWEKAVPTGTATFVLNSDEHPHPDPARPWTAIAAAPAVGKPATGC